MSSAVEQEIRSLIQQHGRITFARFMQVCLYSPNGGFFSDRSDWISNHFGTAPGSHPVFGALIARQLEQMWTLMGEPPVFHVVEVGSGDGVLAQSIVDACRRTTPRFADALGYVAADYRPRLPLSPCNIFDWPREWRTRESFSRAGTSPAIQFIKGEGLRAFRNVSGCILCNELIDNFPVHRYAVLDGRVREVFVSLQGESFTEVLDEPSTPRIEARLAGLGLRLPEGYRGEVNLAMEDWVSQLSEVLKSGFVLTLDYGDLAAELYSPQNASGTVVCYNRHTAGDDPYSLVGQQDITCQVDFTSLIRLGERHGLDTVGYLQQRQFLDNLGISSYLAELDNQEMSAARKELNRIAIMSLVDPEDYGSFKVLAQSREMDPDVGLMGFSGRKG